ncbi:MAG: TonB-dependent receptor [Flavobacteriales bacterium]|nr:TonB-dependent receptor [Flavobacteriales bacterium]
MSIGTRSLLTSLWITICGGVFAQTTGTVSGDGPNAGPLFAANVFWAGTTTGTTTDMDGGFSLAAPPQWPAQLVASYVGFKADTTLLQQSPTKPLKITLHHIMDMKEVQIVERVSGTQLSTRTTIATENIGAKELKRAACCDLSESFETNATVDVNYSDAVSGTKTIRMLGLDGRYAQISLENLPFIRGLSSGYGLTLIRGTWIQDINLSKGLGTAVNGPNAMTGQIDLCLLDPLAEGPLFMNIYGNSQGRMEANVHSAQSTGKNSGNILMVHGNMFQQEMDQNKDGFLDSPKSQRFNIMDRWMRRTERGMTQIGLRYVTDERIGGQTEEFLGQPRFMDRDTRPYIVDINNELIDVFGKQGIVFKNDPTKSVGFLFAGRQHEVGSRFGERVYTGEQQSMYVSAVYQMLLGTGTDQLKAGLSYQFDEYDEAFRDSTFGRVERMPGAFAEYTIKRGGLTLVSGIRADMNSYFGNNIAPRLHAKYDLGPLTNVRFSTGQGFRTALPLIENSSVMASSRNVVVEGNLGMERSWNIGGSFQHKFKWLERKWAFNVDLYRTEFTHQVVTDLDRAPTTVAFYNLDGSSYANSLLTDLQVEVTRQLDLKLSYRYYEAKTTYDSVLRERPFTPGHRGLVSLAYTDKKEHWRADVSLNIFGEGRIPNTSGNPEAYRMAQRSPSYGTLHAQVTRVLGAWEIYLGGENLTSTLQQQQIIAAEDPFGPYFDASLIWGPTNKAMIYGGFRFTIPKKKQDVTP